MGFKLKRQIDQTITSWVTYGRKDNRIMLIETTRKSKPRPKIACRKGLARQ